jgi:cellulose synthase (UDP-forming)
MRLARPCWPAGVWRWRPRSCPPVLAPSQVQVIRPCPSDVFYRHWPENCTLAPALTAARRHAAARHQSLAQHLTDVIWHSQLFRYGGSITVAVLAILFASRTVSYWRYRRRAPTVLVARPPGGDEQVRYFRMQGRRLLTVLFTALAAGSVYGMWQVFSKSWVWMPWLSVLAVLIPWSLYTIVITLRRPPITLAGHTERTGGPRDCGVDVFIPYAGEDVTLLENTFRHIAELEWDGPVHAWLLDDSRHGGDHLRQLASEHGVFYLRRPDRGQFKKAGNMNAAAAQTFGEFILVFDVDFVPAPGFLTETIPYFDDPATGIVQTAQYFSTSRRDTANWMARLAGIVQGMFFCWCQPGNASLDSAMCVGTNVLYRRTALEAAGGFVNISGGEDVVTGVQFLAAGYKTVYVPLNLARGLCPETFASTINQQYRWCLTTIAMVVPVRGIERVCDGFWSTRMPLSQRLVFLSGLLYYAQSVLTLVVSVMPSLIMLWCYPFQVGPGNYLPILPAMLGMIMLPLMVPGWRPEMLRLSLVYAVAHLVAVIDSATGRVAPWVPSSSSGSGSKTPRRAAIILRSWVVVTQGLAWWAITRDLPVYGLPAYWPAILLTAVQTVIFAPLLLPGFGTVPVSQVMRRSLHERTRSPQPPPLCNPDLAG